jgi:hypothetical protein
MAFAVILCTMIQEVLYLAGCGDSDATKTQFILLLPFGIAVSIGVVVWCFATEREPGVWSACVRVLKQVPTNELDQALPDAMVKVTDLLLIKLDVLHATTVKHITAQAENIAEDRVLQRAHVKRLAEYRNQRNRKWFRDPALLIDVPLQVLIRCQEGHAQFLLQLAQEQEQAQRQVRPQQQAGEAPADDEVPPLSPSAAPPLFGFPPARQQPST